jgi:hypothetical protein
MDELIAALEREGATLEWIGGNCPVQAEGFVDGKAFYFRARGDTWQFHVAPSREEIFDNDVFYMERDYGEGPFDAGWMPEDEALAFIGEAIAALKARSS